MKARLFAALIVPMIPFAASATLCGDPGVVRRDYTLQCVSRDGKSRFIATRATADGKTVLSTTVKAGSRTRTLVLPEGREMSCQELRLSGETVDFSATLSRSEVRYAPVAVVWLVRDALKTFRRFQTVAHFNVDGVPSDEALEGVEVRCALDLK